MGVTPETDAIERTKLPKGGYPGRILLGCLVLSILIAFAPTYAKLIAGPWRTDQEGHGPFILLAAGWLAWQCRNRLRAAEFRPAPLPGWTALLMGLAILILGRSQDVTMIEVGSEVPILCGCILLVAGWRVLRILAFPLAFLVFVIPPPGWMMDVFTVPLKAMVSDRVAEILYDLDYPVAQNGVIIMIGSYELMVKDACAGMNSIFALSAIGVFYIHEFARSSRVRTMVLLLSIVPITIAANFARVIALVLTAYYFGIGAIEGIFHDLTGFALFAAALALFFMLDGILLGIATLFRTALRASPPMAVKPSVSSFTKSVAPAVARSASPATSAAIEQALKRNV
jgi:exosortase B